MHDGGQRFGHDQGHGPLFMFFKDFGQDRLYALSSVVEHLAFGRADDGRLVLPLSVNFGLLSLYILDQHTLPQTVVNVVRVSIFFSLAPSASEIAVAVCKTDWQGPQ